MCGHAEGHALHDVARFIGVCSPAPLIIAHLNAEHHFLAGLECGLAQVRAGGAAEGVPQVALRGRHERARSRVRRWKRHSRQGMRARTLPHALLGKSVASAPASVTVTVSFFSASARPHVQFAHALRPAAPTCEGWRRTAHG